MEKDNSESKLPKELADYSKHLENWLDASVYAEDRFATVLCIVRALNDDPGLIDRGLTWSEIAERGAP